jgi:hypothetical protein
VVGPIGVAEASLVAGSAAYVVGAGAVGAATTVVGAAAGVSSIAKVAAAVVLAVSVGGGAAAVTGNLPDPAQTWIADVADRIGVDLPRPVDSAVTVLDPVLDPILDPVLDPVLDPRRTIHVFPTAPQPGDTPPVSSPAEIGGLVPDATSIDDMVTQVGPTLPADLEGVDTTLPLP